MADNKAKGRAQLLSGHLNPDSPSSTIKAKKSKGRKNEQPADWSDVLSELDQVRKLAQTPKIETTGYQRHKEAGKLWVRERIELLLDKGTFREVGSAAGTATWAKPTGPKRSLIEQEKETVAEFTPSNNVQGTISLLIIDCPALIHHKASERFEVAQFF